MAQSGEEGDRLKSGVETWREKILLADYGRFAESFWKNETGGETRVQIFIGLVTAVLAALVALAQTKLTDGSGRWLTEGRLALVLLFSLLGLLCLGWLTFLRMVRRNCVTDEYKQAMDYIRERYNELRPSNYNPFPEPLKKYPPYCLPSKLEDDATKKPRWGGLAHLVAVINGIIFSGCIGIVPFMLDDANLDARVPLVLVALVMGAAVAKLQIIWADKKREDYRRDLKHAFKVNNPD